MKNSFKKLLIQGLIIVLLVVLLYFPLFGHLDSLPIRIWDEARLAINAFEMYENGNYLVTHFEGNPDMWNTKPPLLIWFQVFFMKLIGVNELSVRLPSAISALFTCGLFFVFFKTYLKSYWFGAITVLILITSEGYINEHASRTGDYDVLLTLFTTAGCLSLFLYTTYKKNVHLYWFFIFLSLGVLTKSVTGLLFCPAIFIYILIQKQFISLVKNKHFYFGLCIFIITIATYYCLREVYNPGYLKAVQQNELGGRYLEVLENNSGGFWYYYNNLLESRFSTWFLYVLCGLVVGVFSKDEKIRKITVFSSLMILTFFVIISTAQTKLKWYDVPLYPFLAILVSVFIYFIFNLLSTSKQLNAVLKYNVFPILFLLIIGLTPYKKIIGRTYLPKEYSWHKEFYALGHFLKGALKNQYDLQNQYISYDGYYAQNLFYIKRLNNKGINISLKHWTQLNEHDTVIICQDNVKQYIEQNYHCELTRKYETVLTYKIHGRK